MKHYEIDDDGIITGIIETLEKDTGRKVFTMKIFKDHDDDETLEMIVVFEDKNILHTLVSFKDVGGKMEVGLKGNFL